MQPEAFKPQGGSGVTIVSMGAPPKRMAPVGAARSAPLPMDPASRGAAISSTKEIPRGAKEVKMAGTNGETSPAAAPQEMRRQAAFQPQVAPLGGLQPALAQPKPFLPSVAPRGETVYRVSLRGRTADGAEWVSTYDAVFPIGTQAGAPEAQLLS